MLVISQQKTFKKIKVKSISFKNYFLGAYFIDSVFDICDGEGTEEGLTLIKVKERHCLDFLTTTIGMLEDNIARVFEAIDENGNGFVSKQESFNAIDRRGYGGGGGEETEALIGLCQF